MVNGGKKKKVGKSKAKRRNGKKDESSRKKKKTPGTVSVGPAATEPGTSRDTNPQPHTPSTQPAKRKVLKVNFEPKPTPPPTAHSSEDDS